jgi:3-oxoacyl-[acyl-carrier-protein] synthase II
VAPTEAEIRAAFRQVDEADGGAGGIESVFTVMAVHQQKVPPTINLLNPDPECDLDYCANTARDLKIDVALKNNFGFGGTNGSLVFKRI